MVSLSISTQKSAEKPEPKIEKSENFDWSKPEETENEELELDWSDDDEDVSMAEDSPEPENMIQNDTNVSDGPINSSPGTLLAREDLKSCALNAYLLQAFAAKQNIFSRENVEDVIDALVWVFIFISKIIYDLTNNESFFR